MMNSITEPSVPKTLVSFRPPSMLWQSLTERLVDGILILSEQGDLIYANTVARQLCQRFPKSLIHTNAVPTIIWQLCRSLMENHDRFPSQSIVLEEEIGDRTFPEIRVRVQWLELGETQMPYFLVMLEDRYQSLQNLAIAERLKYGLTARETDVWLRQQSKQSYKEIANELHISVNTVKKHVKNVRAKQDAFYWATMD